MHRELKRKDCALRLYVSLTTVNGWARLSLFLSLSCGPIQSLWEKEAKSHKELYGHSWTWGQSVASRCGLASPGILWCMRWVVALMHREWMTMRKSLERERRNRCARTFHNVKRLTTDRLMFLNCLWAVRVISHICERTKKWWAAALESLRSMTGTRQPRKDTKVIAVEYQSSISLCCRATIDWALFFLLCGVRPVN